MEFDHLFPLSLGGETTEENLWLACGDCNTTKNNQIIALDPESGELVSIFNPRNQLWNEHFAWNETNTIIIGLTQIGRATVIALNLNRSFLVEARELWVSWGAHPPKD